MGGLLDSRYEGISPGLGSLAHGRIAEASGVYRPRHPERTSFYRIFEQHFPTYVGTYEERFEHRCGPLRPVVSRTVEAFLDCGRLVNGFARIRCPTCGGEHLLAFSCQTRNFCPSCQAKRAALFAERLAGEIAAPVPHRHIVFTIPKVLRGLFQRERRLLGLLSRCAYQAVRRAFATYLDDRRASPGFVASIQTFGSYAANFHPHIHALVTEGAFSPAGEFLPVGTVNEGVLEELFRRLVLRSLHRQERLSEEFRDNLLSWVHSGFSVHAGPRLYPTDPKSFERLGRYVVRVPMPQKDVRLTPEGQVQVTTPVDPRTGRSELLLDPLEWIHSVVQQIPAPRQHMVRYYGAYANRRRRRLRQASQEKAEATSAGPAEEEPVAPRASWARLLHKIFEIDPLLCPKCQVEMKIVSVITEPAVIDRILAHIRETGGRDPFDERGPPEGKAIGVGARPA